MPEHGRHLRDVAGILRPVETIEDRLLRLGHLDAAAVSIHVLGAEELVRGLGYQPVFLVAHDQQPFAPRGGGDIDGRGRLRRQAVEEGGRRVGEVVGLHQHTADEQRIRVREGVFTPFGRNQLVLAWHDRGQPTTTRQPVEHLTRLVVGDAEDRHRFFDGDDRLLLPFQAQDES